MHAFIVCLFFCLFHLSSTQSPENSDTSLHADFECAAKDKKVLSLMLLCHLQMKNLDGCLAYRSLYLTSTADHSWHGDAVMCRTQLNYSRCCGGSEAHLLGAVLTCSFQFGIVFLEFKAYRNMSSSIYIVSLNLVVNKFELRNLYWSCKKN